MDDVLCRKLLFHVVIITNFVTAISILNCTCGEENYDLASRIIGGKSISTHKYPWVVLIDIDSFFCSGVLINDLYVLTADHCVDNKEKDLNFDIYLHTEHRVERKGIKFTPVKVLRYRDRLTVTPKDVALIKLNRRVEFEGNTFPICLPDTKSKYTHHNVTVIGWGITEQGSAANKIHEATLTVMTDHYCKKSGIGKHYESKLHLCAFREHTDACRGDSGGPLFYNARDIDNPKYEVIGLVSWGIKCASSLPGVYTKISHYIKWITKNTQDAGYCTY